MLDIFIEEKGNEFISRFAQATTKLDLELRSVVEQVEHFKTELERIENKFLKSIEIVTTNVESLGKKVEYRLEAIFDVAENANSLSDEAMCLSDEAVGGISQLDDKIAVVDELAYSINEKVSLLLGNFGLEDPHITKIKLQVNELTRHYKMQGMNNLLIIEQVNDVVSGIKKEFIEKWVMEEYDREPSNKEAITMTNMDIISSYYAAADPAKAGPMAAYMKNQFPYLGLQKPQRAELSREFLKQKKAEPGVDLVFIERCFALPEREFSYLALTYLDAVKNRLTPNDLPFLEQLVQTRPWWDTVDTIAPIAGDVLRRFPEEREAVAARWMAHESLWVRRVSILFQLKYKAETDTKLLERAIQANCDTREFFLNKAIGWALREYSKTDAAWVRAFIASHKLHPLSVREGSKYM